MKPGAWVNLAIVAAVTFYIIQIVIFIFAGNICQNYAFDFCAFWSVGKVSNEIGLVKVYDINLLKEYQKEIYLYEHNEYINFNPCPVPYLPIFLIPFRLLALLDHKLSFIIWTLLNILIFILYLRFFTRNISGQSLSWRLLLLFMLTLPVFVNFQEGQVNVLLMIFGGEFIRTYLENKPRLAGLWLAGWLLKPQLLILIIPFLLLRRSIKVLIGFFISSLTVLLISFSLINVDGLIALKNLLFDYSQGIPTNNIAAMMNWRMLGWHISTISSSALGWVTTIIGALITTCLISFILINWEKANQTKKIIGFMGIFAATCAITWHSHLHMAMILIPPMIYLLIKNQIDKRILFTWVFTPICFQFFGYLIAYFLQSNGNLINSFQTLNLMRGLPGLLVNLLLLGWTISQFINKENKLIQSQGGIKDNTG